MSDEDPRGPAAGGDGEYCREVEAYLCRKNDGHLIRIAGPSFMRVSDWARQGIPLNVVYRGIDRYFERYYARGPRRRPVQIDFCENDVLDVFDEWRRAVHPSWDPASAGLRSKVSRRRSASPPDADSAGQAPASAPDASGDQASRESPAGVNAAPTDVATRRRVSLAAHLERVIVRLTRLRAGARLTPDADAAVAAAIRGIDAVRGGATDARGGPRDALLERLRAIDADLVAAVRGSLDARTRQAIEREAREQLARFRAGMAEDAYARALAAREVRALREHAGLPVVEYEDE